MLRADKVAIHTSALWTCYFLCLVKENVCHVPVTCSITYPVWINYTNHPSFKDEVDKNKHTPPWKLDDILLFLRDGLMIIKLDPLTCQYNSFHLEPHMRNSRSLLWYNLHLTLATLLLDPSNIVPRIGAATFVGKHCCQVIVAGHLQLSLIAYSWGIQDF